VGVTGCGAPGGRAGTHLPFRGTEAGGVGGIDIAPPAQEEQVSNTSWTSFNTYGGRGDCAWCCVMKFKNASIMPICHLETSLPTIVIPIQIRHHFHKQVTAVET
jgi:hypothetical protein